jgi:hypothetical protein
VLPNYKNNDYKEFVVQTQDQEREDTNLWSHENHSCFLESKNESWRT